METVRWGVVSTAHIATSFVADAVHAPNADVVAVASRSEERAAAFAREHGIPRAYGSYEALFDDPDVDAVYVATPHTLHAENAADALRAGKAVLCEKPLTVSPDEARALIQVAEEMGGYLAEAMWTHFLPAVQTALGWVLDGQIGPVRHLRADFGHRIPYDPTHRTYDLALGGGALLDLGVYPIALAHLFLDGPPTATVATARFAPNGADEDVSVLATFPPADATLTASFRWTFPNTAYVVGERGVIEIPDFFRAREATLFVDGERADHAVDARKGSGYEHQIVAVSDDVLAGRTQSNIVPLARSLAVQEHMAAATRSMRSSDLHPVAG